MPGSQNHGKKKPVASKRQHGHLRPTGRSITDDDDRNVAVQTQSGYNEENSPQRPVNESSQEVNETLNALPMTVQA